MMQKAVNAEAKVGLKFSTMIWDLNTHCFKSYHPSHNTSSKLQTQSSKNFFRLKKPKPKDLKSALLYDNAAELLKKDNKKDKKKRFQS